MVERKKTGRAKARKAVRLRVLLASTPLDKVVCSTLGLSVSLLSSWAARDYVLHSYNVDACCRNLRFPALMRMIYAVSMIGRGTTQTSLHRVM